MLFSLISRGSSLSQQSRTIANDQILCSSNISVHSSGSGLFHWLCVCFEFFFIETKMRTPIVCSRFLRAHLLVFLFSPCSIRIIEPILRLLNLTLADSCPSFAPTPSPSPFLKVHNRLYIHPYIHCKGKCRSIGSFAFTLTNVFKWCISDGAAPERLQHI